MSRAKVDTGTSWCNGHSAYILSHTRTLTHVEKLVELHPIGNPHTQSTKAGQKDTETETERERRDSEGRRGQGETDRDRERKGEREEKCREQPKTQTLELLP